MAVTPVSTVYNWATATRSSIPTNIGAASAYDTVLWLSESIVATVMVSLDSLQGIVLPPSSTLKPGDPVATYRELLFSVDQDPQHQILFQRDTAPATTSSITQSSSISIPTDDASNITTPPSPTSVVTLAPSSASSSTTSSRPSNGSGLHAGAVAGIAIGCLVFGAFLSGFIFWLCCGKRRRSRTRGSETSALVLTTYDKQPASKVNYLGSGSMSTDFPDGGLPQPLEDKAISGEISKISNAIKNHVQSYYHTGRVNPALIDNTDIETLGSDMPLSTGTLITLLENTTTRDIALRFCIAWAIVPKIQIRHRQSDGFLPVEISECLRCISSTADRSQARITTIARWRTLTAELMQSTYVRHAFTTSDGRQESIGAAVRALDNVLRPYADSRMDNEQRKRNLEEIVKRSALFAFTLFSQPSLWDFDWMVEQSVSSGGLCVFPALVQTVDETGEALRPPRPFSEAVVRRLEV